MAPGPTNYRVGRGAQPRSKRRAAEALSRMPQASPAPITANRLLGAIPPAELDLLRPLLRPVTFARDETLIYRDEPIRKVYFPLAGVVSLIVATADGHAVEVAMIGREGFIGLSVVLLGDPNPYDAVCQIRCQTLALPAESFQRLLPDTPGLHRLIDRYTLALLNQVARTAACNRLHSVEQRLARWLLLARDRVGSDRFPLTQAGLARLLGSRRPFLSSTAAGLRRDSLIRYARGQLQIMDPVGLERRACEDYRRTREEYEGLIGPLRD